MGTITVMWEDTIPVEIEYEYEPAQAATFDSPGCDESLHAIEAKLPNGSDLFYYFGDRGISAIEALLRETLEGKARDSGTERALENMRDREHSRYGRRVAA